VDGEFLSPVLKAREAMDLKLLVAPDHPTPLETRTHTGDPVPFIIAPAPGAEGSGQASFCESAAAASGLLISEGHRLLGRFLGSR
jgi:2,3-bisphosphoglycerate-independent phosphoglycerate mutase